MITFYPGPSKIYPEVAAYMQQAYQEGILSQNHRSEGFMQMLQETLTMVASKLAIPEGYEVFLVSSATECWEIIAQSFTDKGALHLHNGAFGKKWAEYDGRINEGVLSHAFESEALPDLESLTLPASDGLLCLTHNETSNGTMLPDTFLADVRERSKALIAVDATSSMAGLHLPWATADLWFASVQKCFGLAPGLAVLVASPAAISRAIALHEYDHYNSFVFIRENFQKFQTPFTPNTLGIYLLGKVMHDRQPIEHSAKLLEERAADLYSFFDSIGLHLVIESTELRSPTVLTIAMEPAELVVVKKKAREAGIILGNGYGALKESTFRIANFPAITDQEIHTLKMFFISLFQKMSRNL
ncbi:aminotransferase class V-fold PLP-dependent enzyme [Dyadobacter jejuensis]|nr:aminotransferase class V-fold PLP-dependent enzyme [Dyadobacter jejuensis]